MDRVVLKAELRKVRGKQVKALRRQGKLPAILYGTHVEPQMMVLELRDASRTLDRVSASTLVTINLEGQEHIGLVREKQRNPITGVLLHVDFQAVSMEEKLRISVSVDTRGESPAVKNFNGILVVSLDELEVECLPGDLPERIVVDVSGLTMIGSSVRVKEIVLPPNVVALDDPEMIVVVVTGQAAEEVEEAAAVLAEPEVIEKGKKEEEEI